MIENNVPVAQLDRDVYKRQEANDEPEPQFQVGAFVELKKSSQIAEILQLKRNQAVVDLNGICLLYTSRCV